MNCLNCGAPLEWLAEGRTLRCAYCDSVRTPSAEFVASDRVSWSLAAGEHMCPACLVPLGAVTLDGLPGEACRTCQGVLLVDEVFAEVVRLRRSTYTGLERTPKPLDPAPLHSTRHCPGCDRTMETHPYYGPGNQIIDSCAKCGLVWLDTGELVAIEQAVGRR